MASITMSPAEWIAVDDNPIQRDTERHAARADHLKTFHPTHAHVSAAKLPSGRLVKLDGHTRALMWKRGDVHPPKAVEVTVYSVKSLDDAKEFYKTFDNKRALETATDMVSGAFRALGFEPQSGLLSAGSISSSLRLAWRVVHGWAKDDQPTDIYEAINEFAAEILALDELGFRKGRFPLGAIAAFLITYRKHDNKVIAFWRALAEGAGQKTGRGMDGVQAVHELMLSSRGAHGGSVQSDLCAKVVTGVEKFLDDETINSYLRATDLATYFGSKAQKKFRLVRSA